MDQQPAHPAPRTGVLSLHPEAIRSVRGLGYAVVAGLSATIAVNLVTAAISLGQIWLAATGNDAVYGPRLGQFGFVAVLTWTGCLIITGVLFIVWLFQVRAGAEAATGTRHRRHRAWIVFGWFTPIVALWFPWQIVNDIWVASHPATPSGGRDPRRSPRPAIVLWWWLTLLAANLVGQVSDRMLGVGLASPDEVDLTFYAALFGTYTFSDVLWVVAGVLAISIVTRIGRFQEIRRRSPSAISPGPGAAHWTPPADGHSVR